MSWSKYMRSLLPDKGRVDLRGLTDKESFAELAKWADSSLLVRSRVRFNLSLREE